MDILRILMSKYLRTLHCLLNNNNSTDLLDHLSTCKHVNKISQDKVLDDATDWSPTYRTRHSAMSQSFRTDVTAHLVAGLAMNDTRLFRPSQTNHTHVT